MNVDYDDSKINYYYTILFHIPLILAFYLGIIAMKTFLAKKYYWIISLILVLLIGFGVGLHFIIINTVSDWFFPEYYLVSFFSWIEVLQITTLYMTIGVLLFLAFNRFELQEQKTKIMKENNLIQMKAMESKIQPHFLFNSLNNIYSSIKPSNTKAKDYLVRLSDSMRYMIYDIDAEQVPLSDEIDYLKNYVELEKLRFDKSDGIKMEVIGLEKPYMLAPLMLIPLVENCFKHVSRINPHITIAIELQEDLLTVKTENNIDSQDRTDEKSGVGLSTLKSRLDILYPKKYQLSSKHKDGFYYATLKFDLAQ